MNVCRLFEVTDGSSRTEKGSTVGQAKGLMLRVVGAMGRF